MKHSKLYVLVALVLTVLLLCSCGESATEVNIEYEIYLTDNTTAEADVGSIKTIVDKETNKSVNVKCISSYKDLKLISRDLSSYNQEEVKEPYTNKKFNIGNNEYNTKLQNIYVNDLNYIDSYQLLNEDNNCIGMITVDRNTEQVLVLSLPEENNVSGDLTLEQAKTIVWNKFVSQYGEDVAKQYKITTRTHRSSGKYNEYVIGYSKYIGKYKTTDSFVMSVNMQGDIISMNSTKLGIFDLLTENVDEARIARAEKYFKQQFPDIKIFGCELWVDENGKPYLSISTQGNGANSYPQEYFINV